MFNAAPSRLLVPVLLGVLMLSHPLPVSAQDEATGEDKAGEIFARVDQLYANQRSNNQTVATIETLLQEAIGLTGETYAATWRMARIQWWKADGALGNDSKMEREAKIGWEWAEKAVKLNSQSVEGQFWLAANIGQYSLAVGVLRALSNGLENKFLTPLEQSIRIDPGYEDGAPLRTKGTYHLNLPWPMRDIPKAIELLNKASKMAPRGIRNHWYLAQAYEKDDKIPQAITELDMIINAKASEVDPGDLPRLQAWAKETKTRLQSG